MGSWGVRLTWLGLTVITFHNLLEMLICVYAVWKHSCETNHATISTVTSVLSGHSEDPS